MKCEVSSFEVPYGPGLQPSWALWIAAGEDADDSVPRRPASSMLEIEQIVSAWVESRRTSVERVVYKFAGRDVHLRDGSCTSFRWALLRTADWRCLDCRTDTDAIDEYYMLEDSVWKEANAAATGHLCIDCLEQRLGRKLANLDFTDVELNTSTDIPRSVRLTARLNA